MRPVLASMRWTTLLSYPTIQHMIRKHICLQHSQGAGGQTASAIVALQRLGLRTTYAGRFGSDAEGSFGLQSLRDEGVDVTFAEVIEGSRTQVGYIIVEAKRGERTVIWDRDKRLAYTEEESPVAFAGKARVIHLDSHDPPACARMAQGSARSRDYCFRGHRQRL